MKLVRNFVPQLFILIILFFELLLNHSIAVTNPNQPENNIYKGSPTDIAISNALDAISELAVDQGKQILVASFSRKMRESICGFDRFNTNFYSNKNSNLNFYFKNSCSVIKANLDGNIISKEFAEALKMDLIDIGLLRLMQYIEPLNYQLNNISKLQETLSSIKNTDFDPNNFTKEIALRINMKKIKNKNLINIYNKLVITVKNNDCAPLRTINSRKTRQPITIPQTTEIDGDCIKTKLNEEILKQIDLSKYSIKVNEEKLRNIFKPAANIIYGIWNGVSTYDLYSSVFSVQDDFFSIYNDLILPAVELTKNGNQLSNKIVFEQENGKGKVYLASVIEEKDIVRQKLIRFDDILSAKISDLSNIEKNLAKEVFLSLSRDKSSKLHLAKSLSWLILYQAKINKNTNFILKNKAFILDSYQIINSLIDHKTTNLFSILEEKILTNGNDKNTAGAIGKIRILKTAYSLTKVKTKTEAKNILSDSLIDSNTRFAKYFDHNFSIGTLIGFAAGANWQGNGNLFRPKSALYTPIFFPLGAMYTYKNFGLLIHYFELGEYLTFGNSENASSPDWHTSIAPGASLYIRKRDYPLSAGIDLTYKPVIDGKKEDSENHFAGTQARIFVSMDIPLFQLY